MEYFGVTLGQKMLHDSFHPCPNIAGGHCHDHPTTIRSAVQWPHSEYHRDIRSPSDHHRYPGLHPEYSGRTGWSQRGNHMVSRIYGEVPCGTTVISGITEEGHMGIIGNI